MKKLLLLPSLFAAGMVYAQTTYNTLWQDVNPFSSSEKIGGQQVITDAATGNVFTVGNFEGQIIFSVSCTLTVSGIGNTRDIYVAKYDDDGVFIHAVKLGSAGPDDGYTICYRDNYAFVGALVNGYGTIYKLEDDLDLSLTRDLGYDVRPRSLYAYGSTGKMMVGGSFIGTCSLTKTSGTIDLEASNYYSEECTSGCFESFTGIIDMNAYFSYADNPHTTTASNEIMGIWCRNGYIYCTGYFQGDMKWNSASTQVTAQGFQDAFIASVYISTFINTITYANDFIQAGNDEDEYIGAGSSDPGWKECGYGICANGTAVYVTGNLSEDGATPLFDGTAYDGAGAFFARINYSGSVLGAVSWVRESENLSGDPVTRSIGYGIAVDALGNVFATGRCFDDVRLEGSGGGNGPIDIWTAGGCPGFIARYTSTGDIISAEPINQVTELTSNCEGRSITVNGCEVFTTGWVQLNSFQAGNLATATVGASKTAMYIFEFSRDAMISNDIVYCEACASFPNVLNLSASGGAAASYTYAWAPGTYLSSTSSATPTFSMTSCSNSGTTNYVCTITTTVTNYCSATASVSVTAGSTAVGVANAGPDKLVCPLTNYTLGTNMPDGLTYYWEPQYHLTNWNTDQPTYYNTVALSSPITYTVEVTDVCGNVSYDYVTVSNNPLCPHRFANPNQKKAEVFPNPSTGIFSVNLGVEEEEADVEFVVTDLSGRVVQQSTVTTAGGLIPLDLSGEAKGVYILSVTRNGETEVHKLTVE